MDTMNKVEDTKVNWRPAQPKKKKSKLMRIITIPIRILTGARDMYVKSMNNYADKAPYVATGIGGGGGQQPLPRSFSTASARSNESDDLTELIRAVSTRDYGDKFNIDSILPPSTTPSVSRSGSVSNTADIGISGGGNGPRVGDRVMRASSTGRLMKPAAIVSGGMRVPRSASVGMGKIDEDKPIEKFEDEIGGDTNSNSKKGKKKKGKKDDEPRKESVLFPRGQRYTYPGTTTTTAAETTPTSTTATAAAV